MKEKSGRAHSKRPSLEFWFGGKSRIATEIWQAIGSVDNFIEPFAGSLAALLARPDDLWQTGAETVNDADSYLCNFWRALAAEPEEIARWCNWPINETDLLARHLWLVNTGKERISKLEADPEFYDAKVAGWWVWGINAWIGSGWCSGEGPWQVIDDAVQLPHLGNAGRGVNRKLPHLGDAGRGVNRKLPHLGDAGRGVNRKRPMLAGEYSSERGPTNRDDLIQYFLQLAARLRRVRVCCGDWSRVVTNGAMAYGATVGIFLDPPYLGDVRTKDLYRIDNHDIANEVREWAIENGDDNRLRIVLAGYEDEHAAKMPDSWRKLAWMGSKSYGTTAAVGTKEGNDANRANERLWFSPSCVKEMSLFEAMKL
jgi:site-specific DNA-adenine methylase